jgi:LPXTG-motif cell wall-anchored protein
MSKKLVAIAVLALGMFIAAPLAANAQIPTGATFYTEDEAPDATVTSEEVTDPEPVAYSTEEDTPVDDVVGSTDDIDPQIMESGVTIEDKMLTTAGAPEAESGLGTGAIVAMSAGLVALLGAGGFFFVRARKKA